MKIYYAGIQFKKPLTPKRISLSFPDVSPEPLEWISNNAVFIFHETSFSKTCRCNDLSILSGFQSSSVPVKLLLYSPGPHLNRSPSLPFFFYWTKFAISGITHVKKSIYWVHCASCNVFVLLFHIWCSTWAELFLESVQIEPLGPADPIKSHTNTVWEILTVTVKVVVFVPFFFPNASGLFSQERLQIRIQTLTSFNPCC